MGAMQQFGDLATEEKIYRQTTKKVVDVVTQGSAEFI